MKTVEKVIITLSDISSKIEKKLVLNVEYNEKTKERNKQCFYQSVSREYRKYGYDVSKVKNLKQFLFSDEIEEKIFGNNEFVITVERKLETFNLSLFD